MLHSEVHYLDSVDTYAIGRDEEKQPMNSDLIRVMVTVSILVIIGLGVWLFSRMFQGDDNEDE